MVKKTVRKGVFTMNIEKTIKSLERNRFKVTYFEQAEDAAKYLDEAIDGKVVGFGDSITMKSMSCMNAFQLITKCMIRTRARIMMNFWKSL